MFLKLICFFIVCFSVIFQLKYIILKIYIKFCFGKTENYVKQDTISFKAGQKFFYNRAKFLKVYQ